MTFFKNPFFIICVFGLVNFGRTIPADHKLRVNSDEKTQVRYFDNNDGEELVHMMKKVHENLQNDSYDPTQNRNIVLPYQAAYSVGTTLKCSACKITLDYALWKFRKPDGSYDGLPEFVSWACKHLKIETDGVCDGIVTAYKQVVLTLLQKLQLSAEEVCGLILPTTCYAPDLPWNKIKWNVTIPGKVPLPSNPSHPTTDPKETIKVLHLSDIHMDIKYTPGTPVDCKEPLCCRPTSKVGKGSRKAGYWGSLGYCDTPYWTLENLLQHVSKNKYDYILWTGDLPAHNDWSQSKDDQIKALHNLTSLLVHYFPGVPVYPSLGNHESYPVNNFPPGYVVDKNSISWLYDALKKAWSPWLPGDALDTVGQSGCYTALVKPKFRVVSINMNYCNQQNWWMLINPVDPNHELQWLVEVLTKAEENGEKVHILGHIPPGSYDCLPIWSHNYYKIVNRFQSTIIAQFFGHTHADEMEIFYDDETKEKPTNMAYIAPSVTTFYNMHPGYREYVLDGLYDDSTWTVLDHSTYIMNLTKANSLPTGQQPTWDFLYSAKEAYGLQNLNPNSWNELVKSWISEKGEKSSFQTYYRYFYKGVPPKPICDEACKKEMLCRIRSGRSGDSADLCSNL